MSSRNSFFGTGTSLIIILTTCLLLCAAVSNDTVFTIDDASGPGQYHTSPTTSTSIPFSSTDSTNPQWTHENCSNCLEKPDLTAINGGTYTAVYLPPGNAFQYNISFEFQGNAIYVYFILSKQASTSCKFILDGEATPYTGVSMDAFQYQTMVFSSVGLPSQVHTLTITAEGQQNKANYVNFDFANFTRPSPTVLAAPSTNETDLAAPMPSSTPQNNHTTLKAIIGGVVGGFFAVVLLIVVAAFYRSRRLREIEETAHPLIPTHNRSESGFDASRRSAPNERQRLMPYTLSAPLSSHHKRGKSSTSTALGITPFNPSHSSHYDHQPTMNSENRDQQREERRLELNNRLETVTTQMRSLKASYAQDQIRLQNTLQRQRQETPGQNMHFEPSRNTANSSNSDPPLVAGGVSRPIGSTTAGGGGIGERDFPPTSHPSELVPVRMPEPFILGVEDGSLGEPMVNPHVLADMRAQMGLMMDQIQNLRAQQNTPYVQGLTDEPPPGYMDAIDSHHRSS